MKLKNKDENITMNLMTEGSPFKIILAFAFPMLVGNVFQQLYNMVDSIVVGNYVGKTALAAVGTGFPIIFMMAAMFIGLGIGATVLISQYVGAGDMNNVRKTSQTIYTAMILSSIPVSIIGFILCEPILNLINTPADILPMAKQYMMIIFAGMVGSFGFNINSGILQGFGDSRSSLLFLAIATVMNIVLDLIFVLAFRWGVAGVAVATIIAQMFSWIFGVIYMRNKYEVLNFHILEFYFDKEIFKKILKLGLPTGIQQILFSIGIMSLQSLVNSYGSDFIAGFNVANKIDTFAFMPIQSFSNAVTTYTGQNIGAGRMDRVHQGTVAAITLSVIVCLMALIVIPLGPSILALFNSDSAVIDAGMIYLNNVMPIISLLAIVFTLNAVIRGAGESVVPMIGAIVSLWLGRLPAAYYIAANYGKEYMFLSYGVGWIFWLLITVPYYMSGKWKTKSQKLIDNSIIKE
ncbi:MAG: MATE family efflux transporter [Sedimentibacter sp.]|uniref:MATE family efflux transporter n=1 Tax=Sedimentibacter sp. TaxID=1960295 RepID=UPI0029818A8A|nr:MATE family efflux transporter [Sedimentibacter sp.]MDW5298857.1 MATE family efflux transporter [Sedimentibacter sp.]